MSFASTAFVTYLWHYLLARLFYDDLVRPLLHGNRIALVAVAGTAAVIAYATRSTRR